MTIGKDYKKNIEIERKFLVRDMSFIEEAYQKKHLIQGYLSVNKQTTIRVRICDKEAFITVKSRSKDNGLTRHEWEYPIPYEDAQMMLHHCIGKLIDKERYLVNYKGFTWEIDVFREPLPNLILAEIELPSTDTTFDLPIWVTEEVTGLTEYYNSYIASL